MWPLSFSLILVAAPGALLPQRVTALLAIYARSWTERGKSLAMRRVTWAKVCGCDVHPACRFHLQGQLRKRSGCCRPAVGEIGVVQFFACQLQVPRILRTP